MSNFIDKDRRLTSGVDLSQLPAPSVVEEVSIQNIIDEIKEAFLKNIAPYFPKYDLGPSDPISKIIEVFALREKWLRERINEASRQCMIAYATGTNLDNLAAFYGIARGGRNDYDFRRAIVREFDIFSTAGAFNAWVSQAYAAADKLQKELKLKEKLLLDVYPSTTGGGNVIVTLLYNNQGSLKPEEIKDYNDKFFKELNSDNVRPLTDNLQVRNAAIKKIEIKVKATVSRGVDERIVRDNIVKSVHGYAKQIYFIGTDFKMAGLHAALFVSNVVAVQVTELKVDGVSKELTRKIGSETVSVIVDEVVSATEAPWLVTDGDWLEVVIEP